MGDIEIQIRRSTKSTETENKNQTNLSASIKPSAITHEKKKPTDEKATDKGDYWDYSPSYGKVNRMHIWANDIVIQQSFVKRHLIDSMLS